MCPPDRLALDLNQAVSTRRRRRGLMGVFWGEHPCRLQHLFTPPSFHYPHLSHPLPLPEARPFALKHCIRAPPTGHIHFTAATDFTAQLSAEGCFGKLMGTIQQHVTRIWTEWVRKKKKVQNPNPTSIFISQTESSDVVLLLATRWSQLVL